MRPFFIFLMRRYKPSQFKPKWDTFIGLMGTQLSQHSRPRILQEDPYEVLGISTAQRQILNSTISDHAFYAHEDPETGKAFRNSKNGFVYARYEAMVMAALDTHREISALEERRGNLASRRSYESDEDRRETNEAIEGISKQLDVLCLFDLNAESVRLRNAYDTIKTAEERRRYFIAAHLPQVFVGNLSGSDKPPVCAETKISGIEITMRKSAAPLNVKTHKRVVFSDDELAANIRACANLGDVFDDLEAEPERAGRVVDLVLRRLTRDEEKVNNKHDTFLRLTHMIYDTAPHLFDFRRITALAVNNELLRNSDPRKNENRVFIDRLRRANEGFCLVIDEALATTCAILPDIVGRSDNYKKAVLSKMLGVNLFDTTERVPLPPRAGKTLQLRSSGAKPAEVSGTPQVK